MVTLDEAFESADEEIKLDFYNDGEAFTAYGDALLNNDCESYVFLHVTHASALKIRETTFWTANIHVFDLGFEVDRGTHEPVYQVSLKNAKGNFFLQTTFAGSMSYYRHTRYMI